MRLTNIWFVVLFCVLSLTNVAAIAVAQDGAASLVPSLQFDGETLLLAWEGGNPGAPVKEYIPAGQTLEKWTKLASTREYPDIDDPRALGAHVVRMLGESNPQSPTSLIENPNTGEVIVDFIVGPADESFVEFNVFKYAKMSGGGIVAHQFALRAYDDIDRFLDELPAVRIRLLELMAREGLKFDRHN